MISFNRHQFETCLPGKLRVERQDFYGKGNLVSNALAWAVAAGEKLKIARIIERAITINVMNSFLFAKWASELLFHHISMFKNFFLLPCWAFPGGQRQPDIPATLSMPFQFISFKFRASLLAKFGTAFSGAYVAIASFFGAAICFGRNQKFLAALNTVCHTLFRGKFLGIRGALAAAIWFRLAPRFYISTIFPRHHRERIVALFTFEGDRFWAGMKCPIDLLVRSIANRPAEFTLLPWFCVKLCTAIEARVKHSLTPLNDHTCKYHEPGGMAIGAM